MSYLHAETLYKASAIFEKPVFFVDFPDTLDCILYCPPWFSVVLLRLFRHYKLFYDQINVKYTCFALSISGHLGVFLPVGYVGIIISSSPSYQLSNTPWRETMASKFWEFIVDVFVAKEGNQSVWELCLSGWIESNCDDWTGLRGHFVQTRLWFLRNVLGASLFTQDSAHFWVRSGREQNSGKGSHSSCHKPNITKTLFPYDAQHLLIHSVACVWILIKAKAPSSGCQFDDLFQQRILKLRVRLRSAVARWRLACTPPPLFRRRCMLLRDKGRNRLQI